MKNLVLGLILLLGVTASVTGEARNQVRPQAASVSSVRGSGIYYGGRYWSCPFGLRAQAFYSGGVYQSYAYVYPYGYMLTSVWIPGPGVYCIQ